MAKAFGLIEQLKMDSAKAPKTVVINRTTTVVRPEKKESEKPKEKEVEPTSLALAA